MSKYTIKNRNIRKTVWVLVLLLMIMYHYSVISLFSGNDAELSTQKSDVIVEKVVEVIDVISGKEITPKIYDDVEFIVRKLAHFVNFFILGFLVLLLAALTDGKSTKMIILPALICGLIGALIDEGHQLFVAGRSGELRDVCVDFLGVLFSCILFTIMRMVWNVEES